MPQEALREHSNRAFRFGGPCAGSSERAPTWVHVKLALHRLGDALQLDSLQGAVRMDSGGEAAQGFPDESGHLPDGEDLQQLAVNGGECPQEYSLKTSELRSITMG